MSLKETQGEVCWIQVAQSSVHWWVFMSTVEEPWVLWVVVECLISWVTGSLLGRIHICEISWLWYSFCLYKYKLFLICQVLQEWHSISLVPVIIAVSRPRIMLLSRYQTDKSRPVLLLLGEWNSHLFVFAFVGLIRFNFTNLERPY